MVVHIAERADALDVAIGARIRTRRKGLGLSQSALGAKIGVSFQQVQKYERGSNRVAGSTLVAIAAALDTTVGWLVGEEGRSPHTEDAFVTLATPGALEMLQTFAAIARPRERSALLALARAIAEDASADPET